MASTSDNKPIILTFIAVVIAIAVMIAYFYFSTDSESSRVEEISIPVESEPSPEPEVDTEAEPQAEDAPVDLFADEKVELPPVEDVPDFVLPLLDDSDSLARDGVVSLTRHEGINGWLAADQLVRKFVAFVDNIAHGQVAKEPVRALAPEGPFLVKKLSEDLYEIDPASYSRYDLFTNIAVSVDAKRAAEFYLLLRPLIQSAYTELGYGDRKFDDVLFQAAGRLLETPVVDGQIKLVRPVVMYKFRNEKLENLSPAQKQLLRMGPENTRKLKDKIGEVATELRGALAGAG